MLRRNKTGHVTLVIFVNSKGMQNTDNLQTFANTSRVYMPYSTYRLYPVCARHYLYVHAEIHLLRYIVTPSNA